MLISLCSDTTLAKMKSLLMEISGVPFNLEKPDKLDDLDQTLIFKFVGEINSNSERHLNELVKKKIIKVKCYTAGLHGKSVRALYDCSMEALEKYKEEYFPKDLKNEKKANADFFQPVDISHKLYFFLATNRYNEFVKIIKQIDHGKIEIEMVKLSKRIQNLKSEPVKKTLSVRLDSYKHKCRNLRFADFLLITNEYNKNKKTSPFFKKLENEVEKFKLESENKPENIISLYDTASEIRDKLRIAHNNQLFGCSAKLGNRSKMATYIDKVLNVYPLNQLERADRVPNERFKKE